jgi:hypothetical protein
LLRLSQGIAHRGLPDTSQSGDVTDKQRAVPVLHHLASDDRQDRLLSDRKPGCEPDW